MFCINELLGTFYLGEEEMRDELGAIYGENFVCYDSRNENDYIMKDCYCNDDSTLDIIVWYNTINKKIENIEERKCSLA